MTDNQNTFDQNETKDYSLESKRLGILAKTPEGTDPVCFWYQCAMDAINSAEKKEQRRIEERDELDRLRRYKDNERQRIEHNLQRQTMPSVRDLLERVENGDFSFNIQFSFYPNTERREHYYDEED